MKAFSSLLAVLIACCIGALAVGGTIKLLTLMF